MYRDLLDEGDLITICGYEYEPSRALEAVDPIAYRCGLADYINALQSDGYVVEGWE